MLEAIGTAILWAAVVGTLYCFYDFVLDIKDRYF